MPGWFYRTLTPMVVQCGDAYREDIYGRADTFEESYAAAREMVKRHKETLLPKKCTRTPRQNDSFRLTFHYWDEWTGGRFQRCENPIVGMTDREFVKSCWSQVGDTKKPLVEIGSICRVTVITGEWTAINERI
jgi:hypothetical protein